MKIIVGALAASLLAIFGTPSAFAATSLNFDGLTGAIGSPVSSYSESGYTFTAVAGSLSVVNFSTMKELGTTSSATVDLTYSAGTFKMNTLGALPGGASGKASISYTGFLSGAQVYAGALNYNAAIGASYISMPSQTVDQIRFALDAGTASNIAYSFSTVTGVAVIPSVPEPATWSMMIVGLGLIGSVLRYRRRKSHPVSAIV